MADDNGDDGGARVFAAFRERIREAELAVQDEPWYIPGMSSWGFVSRDAWSPTRGHALYALLKVFVQEWLSADADVYGFVLDHEKLVAALTIVPELACFPGSAERFLHFKVPPPCWIAPDDVHRYQVVTTDLGGRSLSSLVHGQEREGGYFVRWPRPPSEIAELRALIPLAAILRPSEGNTSWDAVIRKHPGYGLAGLRGAGVVEGRGPFVEAEMQLSGAVAFVFSVVSGAVDMSLEGRESRRVLNGLMQTLAECVGRFPWLADAGPPFAAPLAR